MDHDRLFKQLLQTFFVEFVELFLPEVDAYLDRSSIEFLDWRTFIRRPNPVAAALMTKMRIPVADRPYVMLECVRMIATLKLNPAKQSLIHGFMSSYLKLSAAEMQVYNREVRQIEGSEQEAVMNYVSQWEEIGEARGIAIGEARGEAKVILRVLRRRFGELPAQLEAQISSLPPPKLESLADAILDFGEIADLERWLSNQN